MNSSAPKMHKSWLNLLDSEFEKPYMQSLREFLIREKTKRKIIFPPNEKTFSALNLTSVDEVKIVILGQDPYHRMRQANGLAFSVEKGVQIPPSLRNIYREIRDDLGIVTPVHGDLSYLARQGVLLLNSVLTVEKGEPASHANQGWEKFTDRIIEILNQKDHLVFMLWGSYAQKKGEKINNKIHCILNAPHPSPLSAHRGFFGCKHFSQANDYLKANGLDQIKWSED